jgi:outer membrane protein OmpA-like peptidoglycan-associated protein
VPADLVSIGGSGNLDPAELGQSEKARSQNRRVTVTVRLEDEP